MLEKYKAYTPKPTNKAELKTVLEAIWDDLPHDALDLAVCRKRLQEILFSGRGCRLAYWQMEDILSIS